MRVLEMVRRHPGRSAVAGVLAVGLFVFGMLWFTPWRLFTDTTVNEALPGAAPTAMVDETADPASDMAMEPMTVAGPVTLADGEFVSLEHESMGRALVVETPNGRRFLRFEDFETSNGPDLLVYLSTKDANPDDWHGYDGDFVDLGPLRGNVGDQNYRLPDDVDLEKYSTAVVWCRRFEVGFAAADLA